MNITSSHSAVAAQAKRAPVEAKAQQDAPVEYEIKQDMYDVADRYSDSREAANSVTGFAIGAFTGAIDGIVKAPFVAYEIAENLIQAETIGPNLKVLGTIAAPIGGALSAIASPIVQAFRDAGAMNNGGYDENSPLTKNGSNDYAKAKFSDDNPSFSSGIMKDLEEFGAKKLGEGEKPYDVPILSPFFSVIGGVVSGAISGVVGLVGGMAAGMLTTTKEIGGAIFGKNQTIGQRIGRAATSPLHTLAIPYGLVKEGLKESVPRGFVDGWKHGPVKPVVDTAKASVKLAAGVIKEAWER
jgi:hypothetical protein